MAVVASWDFVNRRIYMASATWHPYDVYVEYRAYRRTVEAARPFDPLLKMEGNVPKGGGKATPRYVVLLTDGGGNPTKIIPVDGIVEPVTDITGEIFSEDLSDFIDVTSLTQAPRINYTPPAAEIIIQLAQAAQLEQSSFEGEVSIDSANVTGRAVANVVYPAGTGQAPVTTLPLAKAVATARGLDEFFVYGNLSIPSTSTDPDGGNVSTLIFRGQGASLNVARTTVTLIEGCNTSNSHWYNLKVTGYQGGESFYHNCTIASLDNAHCVYENCGLLDGSSGFTIRQAVVSSGHASYFKNCYTDEGTAVIDRNATKLNMRLDNFAGNVKFINQNRPYTSESDKSGSIDIHLNGGLITVDSTCTTGKITLTGFGRLVNNSLGTEVDARGFVSEGFTQVRLNIESLRDTHQGFGERFFVDPVNGNDAAPGTSTQAPLATVQAAIGKCVSGRGDVIFILAPGTGAARIYERIVIDKEDVHIRGPGRGAEFKPAVADLGPVITIQANNCSLAGFVVRAPDGSLVDDCIVVTGKFSRMSKLYVVGAGQTGGGSSSGIVYNGGDYHELHDCESEKNSRSGILVKDIPTSNGSPREISIKGGNFYLNGKDGIEFEGQGTVGSSNRLNRILGANIHDNLGYGVRIDALTSGTVISADTMLHNNSLGSVNDLGLNTHWEVAGGGASAEAIANAVVAHEDTLTVPKFIGYQ